MELRADCALTNQKKQSLEPEYSEYDINEFVTSLGNESLVMSPPTINYFNAIPENQVDVDLIYDHNPDNTIIIVDDVPQAADALTDDGNFVTTSMNNRQLIDDKVENAQSNEPEGSYALASGTAEIETSDFIIVSSEEIINNCEDILDLTTDEVEQIFDDSNLFNNNFNNFLGPKMKDDKMSDCLDEPVEYHTMELCNEFTTKMEETPILITDRDDDPNLTATLKRKGRPKGTRKSCEC